MAAVSSTSSSVSVTHHELELAIERTVTRYAKAPRADRIYVSMKLRRDPVTTQLTELGHLGDVLDVGCGRGQWALLLAELGLASSAYGIDFDQRKLRLARQASHHATHAGPTSSDAQLGQSPPAATKVQFEPIDLGEQDWQAPNVNTILLLDVLHYLTSEQQCALLDKLVGLLHSGGRLIIREAEPQRGLRSRLTRWLELLATQTGYNRAAQRLAFRTVDDWCAQLTTRGLIAERRQSDQGTPLANVLLVTKRRNA